MPTRTTAADGIDRGAIGARVERAAAAFLQERGLVEIAANARYRDGEIDLVMLDKASRDGDTLVFVEVRHRRSAGHGGGAASVDTAKRRRLVRAAQRFLLAHPQFAEAPCRFDVVEASGDPQSPRLNWLRDAFRADET
ncbi:MAG: YraN family protein [Thermomonas sp.]